MTSKETARLLTAMTFLLIGIVFIALALGVWS
jgi:hypothetical protein